MKNPAEVFQYANMMVLPGWLWLSVWLYLPADLQSRTRNYGLILPLLLSVLYAAAAIVHFGSATGGFDSLANVQLMFGHPGSTLAGWVHYLAFDLFVGWIIVRHAVNTDINRLLVIVCLAFTFMLGPVGLFFYCCIQWCCRFIPGRRWASQSGDSLRNQMTGGLIPLSHSAFFMIGLLMIFTLAYHMDTRTIDGVNVWLKPIKFAISLAIYTLTLSWFSNYLSQQWRDSRSFSVFTLIVVVSIFCEILWLTYAAAIGEKSHFNQTHPVLEIVYPWMGVIATVLTAMALVIGIGILRYKDSTLHSLTRYSLGYGLIATFFLTIITASYMAGVSTQSHAVFANPGVTGSVKEPMWLTGWLRDAGDLRIPHFFATHAMQLVPMIGWLLTRLAPVYFNEQSRKCRPAALIICTTYSLFVIALFALALSGKPLL